jgi:hypothetical protein
MSSTTAVAQSFLKRGAPTAAYTASAPGHPAAATSTHGQRYLSVAFTEADILHGGDTFWNGFYPFIDYSSGGSIDGMIKAAEANVAAVSDKTIVIPGHNMPGEQ